MIVRGGPCPACFVGLRRNNQWLGDMFFEIYPSDDHTSNYGCSHGVDSGYVLACMQEVHKCGERLSWFMIHPLINLQATQFVMVNLEISHLMHNEDDGFPRNCNRLNSCIILNLDAIQKRDDCHANQNTLFRKYSDDCFQLYPVCQHIWIDHCANVLQGIYQQICVDIFR